MSDADILAQEIAGNLETAFARAVIFRVVIPNVPENAIKTIASAPS